VFWMSSFWGGRRPADYFARAALAAVAAAVAIAIPELVAFVVAAFLVAVAGLLACVGFELWIIERRARRFFRF
jgi:hypothetical protein